MQPVCIRHTELPGTSKLFADFVYHFDRVAPFYHHDPHDWASYSRAASAIEYPAGRRTALVAALRGQNGPSAALDRLSEPGTTAVITGQQVGLFSGPAYTIYKALTAIRLAQRLSADGIPAVPVFWLATEDHDFAEIDHAWVYNAAGEPHAVRITDAAPLRPTPVGGVSLKNPPIAELAKILQGMPFAEEVVAAIREAYPAAVTLGDGCKAFLKSLLGRYGLLFLDPLDPAIRQIGAPFMRQALSSSLELQSKLMQRNAQLSASGYHAQVHVDQKTSLYFLLNNGERQTLRRKPDEFLELADRAADVSPNALLRPVWQDFLLPTVAYVGGPGELAYLAQSSVLYESLLGRMPVVLPRSSFTILDSRSSKILRRNKISAAQVFTPEEALKEKFANNLVPASIHGSVEDTRSGIASQLQLLKNQLEAFDPTLAKSLKKSESKILYQIDKVGRKTARESLRRDQRALEDTRYLTNRIYPHRHPQERFYSILPLLAQHGMGLIHDIAELVELDCPDHRVHVPA